LPKPFASWAGAKGIVERKQVGNRLLKIHSIEFEPVAESSGKRAGGTGDSAGRDLRAGERGAVNPGMLSPGLNRLIAEDMVPSTKEGLAKLAEVCDDTLKVHALAHRASHLLPSPFCGRNGDEAPVR